MSDPPVGFNVGEDRLYFTRHSCKLKNYNKRQTAVKQEMIDAFCCFVSVADCTSLLILLLCCCSCYLGRPLQKKPWQPWRYFRKKPKVLSFQWDSAEIWIVDRQVTKYASANGVGFLIWGHTWRSCRHFTQKSAAICWVHTERSPAARSIRPLLHIQQHPPTVR